MTDMPFADLRFSLSLRVRHDRMPAEQIVQGFGMPPKTSQSIGMPRVSFDGQPLRGIYKQSYVVFGIPREGEELLADTLARTLMNLSDRREFIETFRSTGGSLEFFVGMFIDANKGFTVDVDLMAQLVSLGIDLDLDIYGSSVGPGKPGTQEVAGRGNRGNGKSVTVSQRRSQA